jgi:Uma2 family endonuclease
MGLTAPVIDDLPHYTYDDYIQWEGNWELINGIPYAMTPAPSKKHQELSLGIASQLKQLLALCKNCHVYQAVDWQITEDTVLQPDVLVVCGDDPEDIKLTIPPELVFEILSPSTTRKDRVLKYQFYREAGVKYYCLVSPEAGGAEVFVLRDQEYQEADDFSGGKITFDLGPCGIAFDFNEVFQEGRRGQKRGQAK